MEEYREHRAFKEKATQILFRCLVGIFLHIEPICECTNHGSARPPRSSFHLPLVIWWETLFQATPYHRHKSACTSSTPRLVHWPIHPRRLWVALQRSTTVSQLNSDQGQSRDMSQLTHHRVPPFVSLQQLPGRTRECCHNIHCPVVIAIFQRCTIKPADTRP